MQETHRRGAGDPAGGGRGALIMRPRRECGAGTERRCGNRIAGSAIRTLAGLYRGGAASRRENQPKGQAGPDTAGLARVSRPARASPRRHDRTREGDFMDRSHAACPIALVVEDDAEVRNLATAVLEETRPRRDRLRQRRGGDLGAGALRRPRGAALRRRAPAAPGWTGSRSRPRSSGAGRTCGSCSPPAATPAAAAAFRPRRSTCRSPGGPSTSWSRPSTRRWRPGPPEVSPEPDTKQPGR